jgi:hypothetical protein
MTFPTKVEKKMQVLAATELCEEIAASKPKPRVKSK